MIRNIATVMRGTVIGQGLGLLVLPLLTRLYDPAAFGHFQLYQSATLVLVVFVSLRFEVALLRAADGRELHATLALCLLSTLATATVLTLAWTTISFGWPTIYAQFPVSPWLVGLGVILIGTFQFLGYLVTREHLYAVSANSKVALAGSYALLGSALGALRISLGLIVADALSRLVASLYLLRALRGQGLRNMRTLRIADLRAAAYKFREFPLITVFGGIINSIGIVLTPIMIYAKFSPEVSGQFALVERAISFPVAMLVGAISQVYMANFANAVRNDPSQVRSQYHSLLRMLVLVGIMPAIIGFVLAPPLFAIVFGAKWELAGTLARIMIPAYLVIFIYGGVNMTLMLLGRQFIQTAWEIFRLGCMIALWGFIVTPGMSVEAVVIMHACVLGGVSLIFLALAEYGVRKGPTRAALENA
ncbi:oligosaccharide flippase family protein [Sphingomonas sp.]|uniref:lipopolysaccharide biosynthesis protein n=1 Tax=Sphingomonas sp. TaxID=28214 RepID=UPI001EC63F4B|nr:oligosaccharide flippase family protein [Sphingomonas sp.]MBX3593333.1 oligosaccharide flippase family protein [Sphingomonas sp.]